MSKHLSPAQLAANKTNAQLSTGPATPDGKVKSSLNALTTALTGRTVLLPSDNLAEYEAHLTAYRLKYRPVSYAEALLVQCLADTDWRLARIPHLLLALQVKGQEEFAEAFGSLTPAARSVRIELETQLKYEKQFRNLQLQQARLHRIREKDLAELRLTQEDRKTERAALLTNAHRLFHETKANGQPFNPGDYGFEFSMAEITHNPQIPRPASFYIHKLFQPSTSRC